MENGTQYDNLWQGVPIHNLYKFRNDVVVSMLNGSCIAVHNYACDDKQNLIANTLGLTK